MSKNWLCLENKIVIVTGGASGIGKAIAQEFLNQGANVVVCDLSINVPKFNMEENSGEMLYVNMDVTNKESIVAAFNKGKEKFGKLDILINNAGINIPSLLIDHKQEDSKYELNEVIYDKVMNINVKGVYLCSQIAGREMLKQGEGVIINISSECGLEGSEGQSIYAASKNAVNSFTRSWAKELGKKGIRILGIAPGIIEVTGLRTLEYEEALSYTRGITIEDLRRGYTNTSTIPIGREGKLTEIANVVCFLASEKAGYVHGITVNVSGGKTRG